MITNIRPDSLNRNSADIAIGFLISTKKLHDLMLIEVKGT